MYGISNDVAEGSAFLQRDVFTKVIHAFADDGDPDPTAAKEQLWFMARDEAKEKEEQNAEKETREGDGRCGNHRRGNLDKRAHEGEHHGCEKNIHITHNPSIPI